VNTIFKDLATMVHEQGSMVDSIEQNVESTTVRVQEGTDQLRQAETYKVSEQTFSIACSLPFLHCKD
jgi:t-SNARE complex subunit (syntaxin)